MVGSGLILWMPRGSIVRGILEAFIKGELVKRGYQPVYTPHIGRLELYRTSGHFPYYRDAQFPPIWGHPFAPRVEDWIEQLETEKKGGQSISKIVDQAFLELASMDEVQHFPFADYEATGEFNTNILILNAWLENQES